MCDDRIRCAVFGALGIWRRWVEKKARVSLDTIGHTLGELCVYKK